MLSQIGHARFSTVFGDTLISFLQKENHANTMYTLALPTNAYKSEVRNLLTIDQNATLLINMFGKQLI